MTNIQVMMEYLQHVFFLFAVFFLAMRFNYHYEITDERIRNVMLGLSFAIVTVISMTMNIDLGKGVLLDGRHFFIVLSGIFGGPFAVAIVSVFALMSRWFTGGVGMIGGMIGIVLLSGSSIGMYYWRKARNRIGLFPLRELIVGALTAIVVALATVILVPEPYRSIFYDKATVPILVVYPLAILFCGYIVYGEKRRRLLEEELQLVAYYDGLTRLPNKSSSIARVKEVMRQPNRHFALFLVDIHRFRDVNDAFGYPVGDQLLRQFADRLQRHFGQSIWLARFSGDEFFILKQDIHHRQEAINFHQQIVKVLEAPFLIDSQLFFVSISCGTVMYPAVEGTVEDLLKCADIALYKAKQLGENYCYIYEENSAREVVERIQIATGLRQALQDGELSLVYQPQYDARTYQLTGFEALVRWTSPLIGFVSPAKFIPIAETTGLIVPMGEWILAEAFQMKRKLDERYEGKQLMLSINLSAVQLRTRQFIASVERCLAQYPVNPAEIELEITESVLIESFETIVPVLEKLKELGFSLALDDFGTGYSALSYVTRLPIDRLKLDKSFVDGIGYNRRNDAVVDGIISLMHDLNLVVVAEGVEVSSQVEKLQQWQCDVFQGYYFNRPLSEADCLQLDCVFAAKEQRHK